MAITPLSFADIASSSNQESIATNSTLSATDDETTFFLTQSPESETPVQNTNDGSNTPASVPLAVPENENCSDSSVGTPALTQTESDDPQQYMQLMTSQQPTPLQALFDMTSPESLYAVAAEPDANTVVPSEPMQPETSDEEIPVQLSSGSELTADLSESTAITTTAAPVSLPPQEPGLNPLQTRKSETEKSDTDQSAETKTDTTAQTTASNVITNSNTTVLPFADTLSYINFTPVNNTQQNNSASLLLQTENNVTSSPNNYLQSGITVSSEVTKPELGSVQHNLLSSNEVFDNKTAISDLTLQLLNSVTPSAPFSATSDAVNFSQSSGNDSAITIGSEMLETLKNQVSVQLTQKSQEATIRLDPPNLGQLEIAVSLKDNKLSVQINADHAGIREALQNSKEQLRQILIPEHGSQVDVDIGQSSSQQSRQQNYDLWQEPEVMPSSDLTLGNSDSTLATSVVSGDWLNTVV